MSTKTIDTTAGQTIDRKLQVLYLNTAAASASSPVWSLIGKRVEDSSAEYDWQAENIKDILGNTYGTLKQPIITQTFDPVKLDAGDAATTKLWELAVRDQNAQALANLDCLIVHAYAENFAERYESCVFDITSLGGEGGGDISMPFNVTFGGTRTLGAASVGTGGAITFTPDTTSSGGSGG